MDQFRTRGEILGPDINLLNLKFKFMPFFQKLLRKLTSIGALGFVIMFILGIFVVSPLLLIWGLNLLGFAVPYTFKSLLGAILVIIVLRVPTQKSHGK